MQILREEFVGLRLRRSALVQTLREEFVGLRLRRSALVQTLREEMVGLRLRLIRPTTASESQRERERGAQGDQAGVGAALAHSPSSPAINPAIGAPSSASTQRS